MGAQYSSYAMFIENKNQRYKDVEKAKSTIIPREANEGRHPIRKIAKDVLEKGVSCRRKSCGLLHEE